MVLNIEEFVDAWTAHISINQQHALPQLCQRNCKITGHGRFAFAWLGANECQRSRRSSGCRKQNRRSQAAKSLRECRVLRPIAINPYPGLPRDFLQRSVLAVSVRKRQGLTWPAINARARIV